MLTGDNALELPAEFRKIIERHPFVSTYFPQQLANQIGEKYQICTEIINSIIYRAFEFCFMKITFVITQYQHFRRLNAKSKSSQNAKRKKYQFNQNNHNKAKKVV